MNLRVNNLRLPLFFIAAAAAMPALAAPINHTISLSATVPAFTFYVTPSQDDWIGDVQPLDFNPVTGDLSTLVKPFKVVNTAGGISGRLTSPALLSSADGTIDLKVDFAGTTLTTTAEEVVSPAMAADPRDVNLEIAAIKTGSPYLPGDYTGNVLLEFDATLPVRSF